MRCDVLWIIAAMIGAPTAASVRTPTVSRVEISPRVIGAGVGQETRVRFYLSSASAVTIDVSDGHQNQVWTQRQSFQRGYNEFRWDGRTNAHLPAPGGVYTVVITPTSGSPTAMDSVIAGGAVAVYELSLDRTSGKLTYRLPEAARVQVRLGMRDGGPLLRTIDTLQGPGPQEVHWDGWDQSHVTNLLGNEDVLAGVYATALPDNALIVRDQDAPETTPEFSFQIQLRKTGNGDTDQRRLLVAEIHAVSNVDSMFIGDRYEWLFFVDHRFVFEEERKATNPYLLQLDVSRLPLGEHVLTVNLAGQTSHYAQSASGRFAISN
jgi:hypothetical protein